MKVPKILAIVFSAFQQNILASEPLAFGKHAQAVCLAVLVFTEVSVNLLPVPQFSFINCS